MSLSIVLRSGTPVQYKDSLTQSHQVYDDYSDTDSADPDSDNNSSGPSSSSLPLPKVFCDKLQSYITHSFTVPDSSVLSIDLARFSSVFPFFTEEHQEDEAYALGFIVGYLLQQLPEKTPQFFFCLQLPNISSKLNSKAHLLACVSQQGPTVSASCLHSECDLNVEQNNTTDVVLAWFLKGKSVSFYTGKSNPHSLRLFYAGMEHVMEFCQQETKFSKISCTKTTSEASEFSSLPELEELVTAVRFKTQQAKSLTIFHDKILTALRPTAPLVVPTQHDTDDTPLVIEPTLKIVTMNEQPVSNDTCIPCWPVALEFISTIDQTTGTPKSKKQHSDDGKVFGIRNVDLFRTLQMMTLEKVTVEQVLDDFVNSPDSFLMHLEVFFGGAELLEILRRLPSTLFFTVGTIVLVELTSGTRLCFVCYEQLLAFTSSIDALDSSDKVLHVYRLYEKTTWQSQSGLLIDLTHNSRWQRMCDNYKKNLANLKKPKLVYFSLAHYHRKNGKKMGPVPRRAVFVFWLCIRRVYPAFPCELVFLILSFWPFCRIKK